MVYSFRLNDLQPLMVEYHRQIAALLAGEVDLEDGHEGAFKREDAREDLCLGLDHEHDHGSFEIIHRLQGEHIQVHKGDNSPRQLAESPHSVDPKQSLHDGRADVVLIGCPRERDEEPD